MAKFRAHRFIFDTLRESPKTFWNQQYRTLVPYLRKPDIDESEGDVQHKIALAALWVVTITLPCVVISNCQKAMKLLA